MTANKTLLQRKYARVIETYSRKQNVDLRKALGIFYQSQTYQDMRNGVSDMHCRSDEYLAGELLLEQY